MSLSLKTARPRLTHPFIALMVLLTTGCSNKAIYDNLRDYQRKECMKQPPATYSQCLERTDKPYEEYKRERDDRLSLSKSDTLS